MKSSENVLTRQLVSADATSATPADGRAARLTQRTPSTFFALIAATVVSVASPANGAPSDCLGAAADGTAKCTAPVVSPQVYSACIQNQPSGAAKRDEPLLCTSHRNRQPNTERKPAQGTDRPPCLVLRLQPMPSIGCGKRLLQHGGGYLVGNRRRELFEDWNGWAAFESSAVWWASLWAGHIGRRLLRSCCRYQR